MYNGQFNQCLSVTISCDDPKDCLKIAGYIKKQCEAWAFNVRYTESKSARKGPVLKRDIMIYQTAYAGDITIFKEVIRRICFQFSLYFQGVKFIDRGAEPINDIKQTAQP